MDESFCSVGCEGGSDLCNITEVIEGGFDSVADVGFKGEGGIKSISVYSTAAQHSIVSI